MWQRAEAEVVESTWVDSAWLWTGESGRCLEKVQRDLDRKITVTEEGRGSPWPGWGAGHRKLSRVTVNKNQQHMLGVHCWCAGERVCCCWEGCLHWQLTWRTEKGRLGGRISARNELFPLKSLGKMGRKCSFFPLSCIKTYILFTQDLSCPWSHTLGCCCSVVLHVRRFSLGSWVQLWFSKIFMPTPI